MSEKPLMDIPGAEKSAVADIEAEEPDVFGEPDGEELTGIEQSLEEAGREGRYAVSEDGDLVFQKAKESKDDA